MAIEWINSPQMLATDGNTGSTISEQLAGMFHTASGNWSISESSIRGGWCHRSTSSGAYRGHVLPAAKAERHFGARVLAGALSANQLFGVVGADDVLHADIRILSTGVLQARRGSTVLAESSAGLVLSGVEVFISARATIADAGGQIEVFVNGAQALTFTGDTKNGGSSTSIAEIRFYAPSSAWVLADLYIGDTTGSAPFNAPLADLAVDWSPADGDGDASDYAVTGASSVAAVAAPFDDDTSYIEGVPTEKHLFTIGALPGGANVIYGVQHCTHHKRTDAGAITVEQIIKTGGTEYTDWTGDPSTGYNWQETLRIVNPDTGLAWTPAEVAALQIGVEYP